MDSGHCKEQFENSFDAKIKKFFKWEQVEKSILYQKAIFKFLILRQVFCSLPFDFCIFYFQAPYQVWIWFTRAIDDAGLCTGSDKFDGNDL